CELGVIFTEVGLAAPSRITLSRQMKLATKNPPAKIHRIFFIERLPQVESDAGSSVAASAPRECFRSSVDAFAIRYWAFGVCFPCPFLIFNSSFLPPACVARLP